MEQWEVPLLRTCFLMLRDHALAEDAVQQTFLKAWRGYDGFRGECSEK
ncbi:MAG: RNA polymerase subunit sigma-70, partial [Clostridiales bacterium]|nr:RNA polymerase subunit sigma-70 [Clostridiales bacterium]